MARIRVHKTNFSGGEISPWILGRRELRAYENGARTLHNVIVHPAGGVTRRPGLRYIDSAAGLGRLLGFEHGRDQIFLLVFSDRRLRIYRGRERVKEIEAPWTEEQLQQINWTQTADTLFIVHPDVPPKRLTRSMDGFWMLSDWVFSGDGTRISSPHHKFVEESVTLQASGTSGNVTVTASADIFASTHVGVRLRIVGREVEVTNVVSPRVAQIATKEALVSTKPTTDWTEQSFSDVRGWPTSVCFHQNRMVIGGSRSLPNYLWLSRTGDLFNFDVGQGLDDESIQFAILSDQVNAIRSVFSGRHLQVLTSGAEWMVTGEPLTPTNIQVRRQTRIGSPVDRTVPPCDVDGATLFVPREGPQLREFLFADTEQAYQATDLALLASHLINQPVDMDFDKFRRLLHVVMADGSLATLTVYRDEQVSAWSRQETDGAFRGVTNIGKTTFVLVERGGGFSIEAFDDEMFVDAGIEIASDTPRTRWSGLDHLSGRSVKVIADGQVRKDTPIADGVIALEEPASKLQVGIGFSHVIEPLPVAPAQTAGVQGAKVRPISFTFRLLETCAMRVDVGRGMIEYPFQTFGQHSDYSLRRKFTGDKTIKAFGWHHDGVNTFWRIEQDTPVNFTILSVSTEMIVNY